MWFETFVTCFWQVQAATTVESLSSWSIKLTTLLSHEIRSQLDIWLFACRGWSEPQPRVFPFLSLPNLIIMRVGVAIQHSLGACCVIYSCTKWRRAAGRVWRRGSRLGEARLAPNSMHPLPARGLHCIFACRSCMQGARPDSKAVRGPYSWHVGEHGWIEESLPKIPPLVYWCKPPIMDTRMRLQQ